MTTTVQPARDADNRGQPRRESRSSAPSPSTRARPTARPTDAASDTRPSPTGQGGELQGFTKIITPATPNKEQVFQSNVNVGINGAIEEMGLEAAYMALSPQNLAGANAGFLRPGAILAVAGSDEEGLRVLIRATARTSMSRNSGARRR